MPIIKIIIKASTEQNDNMIMSTLKFFLGLKTTDRDVSNEICFFLE